MTRPLLIGVNALYLIPGGVGGTELYLRNLLQALAEIDATNRYIVYTSRATGTQIVPPGAANFSCRVQPISGKSTLLSKLLRLAWEQLVLPAAFSRDRVDVVFNPGYTAPRFSRRPSVTVFHDMQHKKHPEFSSRIDKKGCDLFYDMAARSSDRLIAVSRATKLDMHECYAELAPQKTKAIPHGVDPHFFEINQHRRIPPERLILCVSTLHPHKNLDRLLRVFKRFQESHNGYRLVIAGLKGRKTKDLKRMIIDLGLNDSVYIPGWIDRQELYDLFAAASAFVYPTRFEGFGLPILEALAAGLPSACSDIEPLRSIVGDAALLFKPDDEEAILTALIELVENQETRKRLEIAGPRRAARFPWTRSARGTLHALRWAVRDREGNR